MAAKLLDAACAKKLLYSLLISPPTVEGLDRRNIDVLDFLDALFKKESLDPNGLDYYTGPRTREESLTEKLYHTHANPLMLSVQYRSIKLARLLLKYGADPNRSVKVSFLHQGSMHIMSPFHSIFVHFDGPLIRKAYDEYSELDLDFVKEFVQHGAEVEWDESRDYTQGPEEWLFDLHELNTRRTTYDDYGRRTIHWPFWIVPRLDTALLNPPKCYRNRIVLYCMKHGPKFGDVLAFDEVTTSIVAFVGYSNNFNYSMFALNVIPLYCYRPRLFGWELYKLKDRTRKVIMRCILQACKGADEQGYYRETHDENVFYLLNQLKLRDGMELPQTVKKYLMYNFWEGEVCSDH